jgi:hypothetical protein
LIAYVHPRTLSPSLHPCPASDRASSFLLASALLIPPPSLTTRRRARREMRPTDFCHPYVKLRAPAPRSFPVHSAAFATWAPRGLWDPRGLTGGPGVSHRPIRFGGTSSDTLLEPRVLSVTGGGSRAWALSSHGAGSTEPLTSLSPLPLLDCAHAPSSVLGSRGPLPAVSAKDWVAHGSDEEEAAKTAVTIEP